LYAVTITVSQEKLLSHIDVYAADLEAPQEGEPMPSLDGTLHPPPPFESMALILHYHVCILYFDGSYTYNHDMATNDFLIGW
jgi:hypothetical protein